MNTIVKLILISVGFLFGLEKKCRGVGKLYGAAAAVAGTAFGAYVFKKICQEINKKIAFKAIESLERPVAQICTEIEDEWLSFDAQRDALPSINRLNIRIACCEIISSEPAFNNMTPLQKDTLECYVYCALSAALVSQKNLFCCIEEESPYGLEIQLEDSAGFLYCSFAYLRRAIEESSSYDAFADRMGPDGVRYAWEQLTSAKLDSADFVLNRPHVPSIIKMIFAYSLEIYRVFIQRTSLSAEEILQSYRQINDKYRASLIVWSQLYEQLKRTNLELRKRYYKTDLSPLDRALAESITVIMPKAGEPLFPARFIPQSPVPAWDIDEVMKQFADYSHAKATKPAVKKVSVQKTKSTKQSKQEPAKKQAGPEDLVQMRSEVEQEIQASYEVLESDDGQWKIIGTNIEPRVQFDSRKYTERVNMWFRQPMRALHMQGYTDPAKQRFVLQHLRPFAVAAHTFALAVSDDIVNRHGVEIAWRSGQATKILPCTFFFEDGGRKDCALTFGMNLLDGSCYHRSTTGRMMPLLEQWTQRLDDLPLPAAAGAVVSPVAPDGSYVIAETKKYILIYAPDNPFVRSYTRARNSKPYHLVIYKILG